MKSTIGVTSPAFLAAAALVPHSASATALILVHSMAARAPPPRYALPSTLPLMAATSLPSMGTATPPNSALLSCSNPLLSPSLPLHRWSHGLPNWMARDSLLTSSRRWLHPPLLSMMPPELPPGCLTAPSLTFPHRIADGSPPTFPRRWDCSCVVGQGKVVVVGWGPIIHADGERMNATEAIGKNADAKQAFPPRVVLRSAGHSELPQLPWRRSRRSKGIGKVRVWRKNSKIDNINWRSCPARNTLHYQLEVLPCKEHFTFWNQAKLLILLRLGVTWSDPPWGRLGCLAGFVPDRLQDTPVRLLLRSGLTGLPSMTRLLPILGVKICPPVF
jgi:hypothetical protein